jgi:hypothetical protein
MHDGEDTVSAGDAMVRKRRGIYIPPNPLTLAALFGVLRHCYGDEWPF